MSVLERIRFKPMDFSQSEVSQVIGAGRVLVLAAETSAVCSMNCTYCYRREAASQASAKELDGDERIKLIEDAAALGAKAYHIVGAGEPLRDPILPLQLEAAKSHGMEIMVATDGQMLDSGQLLGLLERTHASILLKLNSFREDVERKLTGRAGYAAIRNRVLSAILARKTFNQSERSGSGAMTTRLAINGMITKLNLDEMLDILAFCRENSISPFLTSFLPVGRTASGSILLPERADLETLFEAARRQDLKAGVDDGAANIYLGGQECNQRGLVLLLLGKMGHADRRMGRGPLGSR